jgi:hypothetical protein
MLNDYWGNYDPQRDAVAQAELAEMQNMWLGGYNSMMCGVQTARRGLTIPTKTLLQGCKYVPSWASKPPVRYTTPTLRGHYGLCGHYRNQAPEGSAKEQK